MESLITIEVIFAGSFFPTQNWRMIWLGSFLAVGLHFFPFYFVHGISMIGIAFLCSANAVMGIFIPSIPFMTGNVVIVRKN